MKKGNKKDSQPILMSSFNVKEFFPINNETGAIKGKNWTKQYIKSTVNGPNNTNCTKLLKYRRSNNRKLDGF